VTIHPSPHQRRVLLVANSVSGSSMLVEALRSHRAGQILVLAPALNSRLRHWACDDRTARAAARERLHVYLDVLERAGFDANGIIGDADPIAAIDDALRLFAADALVIVDREEGRRNWLAAGLPRRLDGRYALPVVEIAAADTRLLSQPTRRTQTGRRPLRESYERFSGSSQPLPSLRR
jgi:hypothetical protein